MGEDLQNSHSEALPCRVAASLRDIPHQPLTSDACFDEAIELVFVVFSLNASEKPEFVLPTMRTVSGML